MELATTTQDKHIYILKPENIRMRIMA